LAQPFEKARFWGRKDFAFPSAFFDFPSLWLGFSFLRAWIFLPQALENLPPR
jgi:hypothetical protein